MTTSPHLVAEAKARPMVVRTPKVTTAEPTEPRARVRAAKVPLTAARTPKATTEEPTGLRDRR